jgi:hypothetical protein
MAVVQWCSERRQHRRLEIHWKALGYATITRYTKCMISRYVDGQPEIDTEMRHAQVPMGKMTDA